MNGTKGFGILYTAVNDFKLVGYTNSDWTGSLDDRKSTSGYMFRIGYIAANAVACQDIWLSRILIDLNERQEDGK